MLPCTKQLFLNPATLSSLTSYEARHAVQAPAFLISKLHPRGRVGHLYNQPAHLGLGRSASSVVCMIAYVPLSSRSGYIWGFAGCGFKCIVANYCLECSSGSEMSGKKKGLPNVGIAARLRAASVIW
jgi:hypothetical protein